jgi:hypothetical protein
MASISQRFFSSIVHKSTQLNKSKRIPNGKPKHSIGLLDIAEEALPRILGSKSLSSRVKEEIKHHHRWIGIVFFYCKHFPRMLRVVSLGTNIIVMLFVQSITYNLSHGDDGTCESYTSEQVCLMEKSAFQTGASKCYWNAEEKECFFVQPDQDIKVVIFVAILSAVVSTPLALLADWMIQTVLAAPTLLKRNSVTSMRRSNILDRQKNTINSKQDTFESIVSVSENIGMQLSKRMSASIVLSNTPVSMPDHLLNMIQSEKEFTVLSQELQNYRKQYLQNNREQCHEFDSKYFNCFALILISFKLSFCFHQRCGDLMTMGVSSKRRMMTIMMTAMN